MEDPAQPDDQPTLADSLNQAGRYGPDAAALLDAALTGDIAAVEHATSALSEDTATHMLHTALDTLVATQPPTVGSTSAARIGAGRATGMVVLAVGEDGRQRFLPRWPVEGAGLDV